MDPLRVPFADQKDDGRIVGRAVFGEAFLPVHRKKLRLRGEDVDVIAQRECHDIRLQPVDDGAGLLAGAAVGLFELDGLPILRGERLIDLLVELPRGIVGDVEERRCLVG